MFQIFQELLLVTWFVGVGYGEYMWSVKKSVSGEASVRARYGFFTDHIYSRILPSQIM